MGSFDLRPFAYSALPATPAVAHAAAVVIVAEATLAVATEALVAVAAVGTARFTQPSLASIAHALD